MLQLSRSNSAYTLVKNFIIDTNYFNHLKVTFSIFVVVSLNIDLFEKFESQLVILNSLNNIWCKLNTNLLSKYLNKLKVFLSQFEAANDASSEYQKKRQALYTAIFESCLKFSQADREGKHQIYAQIVQFFYFVCSEFSFNVSGAGADSEKKLVNLMADVVIKLEDEHLLARISSLEEGNLNEIQFLKILYFKCRLIIQGDQPFRILNSSIQIILDNIE